MRRTSAEYDVSRNHFGLALRKGREVRGWTWSEFAANTGIHHRTLRRLSKGATPTAEQLSACALALDVEMEELWP